MPRRAAQQTSATKYPDRDTSIGQFVRARRRTEGLSQRGLAELAGVGPEEVAAGVDDCAAMIERSALPAEMKADYAALIRARGAVLAGP